MARSQGRWWIDTNYPPAMIAQPDLMMIDNQYQIFFNDLLSCVYQIIQFEGLPDTIDPTYLKMCLYLGGRVAIFRNSRGDGEIRALDCSTAGEPDIYYMPSKIMIVNPTFKGYSYQLDPDIDVAVIFCREVDRYQYGRETGGLFGLISTTAQLLADNTISINVATKNMRLCNVLAADDDITKLSMQATMDRMYRGDPYVVAQKTLADKLESIPVTAQTNTQQLMQLLQTRQYILSHFYEQIGLKTHDQMKKERLITSEIDEGTELSVFNVQDMIAEIQRGIDIANRIFELDIKIRLHPLIADSLENPADGQTADQTGDGAADDAEADDQTGDGESDDAADDDQTDGELSDDQTDGEPADDQTGDGAADDQTDGELSDDQTGDGAADDQTDGEPAEDQADDAAVDDQTGDGADDDQTDGEPAEDQTDEQPQPIEITISGDVSGDVQIDINTDGGDDDADIP